MWSQVRTTGALSQFLEGGVMPRRALLVSPLSLLLACASTPVTSPVSASKVPTAAEKAPPAVTANAAVPSGNRGNRGDRGGGAGRAERNAAAASPGPRILTPDWGMRGERPRTYD